VTLDGVLDWTLDLLTTLTHHSLLHLIIAPLQISTLYSSLEHMLSFFPACCVFTNRSRVTASNSGDYSASALKSSLNGGPFQLLQLTFFFRLPQRTELVAPIVFLIISLHEPSRKHRFQQYLYCRTRIRSTGTCLPSR
jgi:hypothetical protein